MTMPVSSKIKVNLYMHYNDNDVKVPKIWACNDNGDLIFGSVNKSFAYQKKTASYLATTRVKKIRDGYKFLASVTVDILTGPRWDLLKKFWYGNPLAADVAAMRADTDLRAIADAIVRTNPLTINGKSKVSSLENNMIPVKKAFSSATSAAIPSQLSTADVPPKARKTKVKLKLLKESPKPSKTDNSWSW